MPYALQQTLYDKKLSFDMTIHHYFHVICIGVMLGKKHFKW